MTKRDVEEWFRGYGLMLNGLTDEQYEQFCTLYDNERADDIDDGDEFYDWMCETAEELTD